MRALLLIFIFLRTLINYNIRRLDSMIETPRLRIAMVIESFPNYSETFVSRKVDYLLEQGHDVHIFCHKFNSSFPGAQSYRRRIHLVRKKLKHFFNHPACYCLSPLVALVRLPFVAANNPKSLFSIRDYWMWTGASFFSCKWDIVHCHYLVNVEMLRVIVNDISCPVVASIYGYDVAIFPFQSKQHLDLTCQWLQMVDGVSYSSNFLQQETKKIAIPHHAEECIIWPETQVDFFTPIEKKEIHQPYRILSVGRLHWSKGYSFAMRTMAILKNKGLDFQYRIIGEGNARQELEYVIRSLDLTKQVLLEGKKTTHEVRDAMRWADVFLLSSVRESFGSVLVEAQASGLPVVASRIEGIGEAVDENKTAILVEAGNPSAFADALLKIYDNPQLFDQMSDEGHVFAWKYDLDKSGKKLEQFYLECMNRHVKK